jgi:hypothetical protein
MTVQTIAPYTDEQFKLHVTGQFMTVIDTCLVCDQPLRVTWTDRNGEARCLSCGMTYDILGCRLSEKTLSRHELEASEIAKRYAIQIALVPLYRVYWSEMQRRLPMGSYMSDRDRYSQKDYDSFYRWLATNAARFRPAFEDFWNWDAIIEDFEAARDAE